MLKIVLHADLVTRGFGTLGEVPVALAFCHGAFAAGLAAIVTFPIIVAGSNRLAARAVPAVEIRSLVLSRSHGQPRYLRITAKPVSPVGTAITRHSGLTQAQRSGNPAVTKFVIRTMTAGRAVPRSGHRSDGSSWPSPPGGRACSPATRPAAFHRLPGAPSPSGRRRRFRPPAGGPRRPIRRGTSPPFPRSGRRALPAAAALPRSRCPYHRPDRAR